MEKWIYLASFFGGLKILFLMAGVFTIICGTIMIGNTISDKLDNYSSGIPVWASIVVFIIGLCTTILGIATPDKDTCYKIMAIHLGEQIITNDKVEEITSDTLELVDAWIQSKKEEYTSDSDNTK